MKKCVIFLVVTGCLLGCQCYYGHQLGERQIIRTSARMIHVKGLLWTFFLCEGDYPEGNNEACVEDLMNADVLDLDDRCVKRIDGKYLLVDDWGQPFVYKCPGRHNKNSYDLYSIGRNGTDEGGKGHGPATFRELLSRMSKKAKEDDMNNWTVWVKGQDSEIDPRPKLTVPKKDKDQQFKPDQPKGE